MYLCLLQRGKMNLWNLVHREAWNCKGGFSQHGFSVGVCLVSSHGHFKTFDLFAATYADGQRFKSVSWNLKITNCIIVCMSFLNIKVSINKKEHKHTYTNTCVALTYFSKNVHISKHTHRNNQPGHKYFTWSKTKRAENGKQYTLTVK